MLIEKNIDSITMLENTALLSAYQNAKVELI